MTKHKKPRGRPPKNSETLERERFELMLKNLPEHLKNLRPHFDINIEEMDAIEKDLLSGYSPTIPHNLIYQLASLGDESLCGYEDIIINKYNQLIQVSTDGQKLGANATAEKALTRAHKVWDSNQDLVNRIDRKNLTIHTASMIIITNWATRGDSDKKPTLATLRNWYNKLQKK